MEKKDIVEIEGIVTQTHPTGFLRVLLDNQETILASISGNIRQKSIQLLVGDRVKVELHICDLTRGRIIQKLSKAKN